MSFVLFHCEEIDFSLSKSDQVASWIQDVLSDLHKKPKELNFIFCSDEYLLALNREYLEHDYYTDIITFDNSEATGEIEGDVFISIDRVKENAHSIGVPFTDELHRVIIHGVLHLAGHNDKTEAEKLEMRKIEDHYLALRQF